MLCYVMLSFQITQTSRIITIDVRHPGSHDPGCRGESGRQHRPTGPDTALRYSGEKDNGDTSGSIREVPLGTVSGSLVVSCLLYTSPSPRDGLLSRMPSSA